MAFTTTTPGARARRTPKALARLLTTGAVALTLAGVAACSTPAPAPETPEPVTVTPTIEPSRTTPPEPAVPVVWPLTGVAVGEVAARPAVGVKVENTSAARPQSGLEAADVVWETIVEFEVSRLIAVFHSQVPAEVGPIRSVRPMDAPILAPTHGLLVFSGGQRGILRDTASSGLQTLSNDDGVPGMYRVRSRSAPHNVYGSVESFMAQADANHSAPPPQQFAFALRPDLASATVAGAPATTLAFRLSAQSAPSWTWDSGSGTWLRSEASGPATVASGSRISAVNVVSITAGHPNSAYDAQGGAPVPTYAIVGQGEAVVATGGKVIAGTWSKASNDSPLQLFLPDGTPLLLAPGNTWVELVPAGKGSLRVS